MQKYIPMDSRTSLRLLLDYCSTFPEKEKRNIPKYDELCFFIFAPERGGLTGIVRLSHLVPLSLPSYLCFLFRQQITHAI